MQTDTEELGVGVTYSIVDGGSGVTSWLDIDPATGVITGTPDNTKVGVYTFGIHAHSDTQGEANQSFTLTVDNAAPLFLNAQTDIFMTQSSGQQTFDVQNNDEGVPSTLEGYRILSYDGIDYGQLGFPAWLSIDYKTGIITGNPLNQDVGDHTIQVSFDDGTGKPNSVETMIFNLHVANIANDFTSQDATTWFEDQTGQSFDVQTHEEGDGNITYSLVSAPHWVHINAATGEISVDSTYRDWGHR